MQRLLLVILCFICFSAHGQVSLLGAGVSKLKSAGEEMRNKPKDLKTVDTFIYKDKSIARVRIPWSTVLYYYKYNKIDEQTMETLKRLQPWLDELNISVRERRMQLIGDIRKGVYFNDKDMYDHNCREINNLIESLQPEKQKISLPIAEYKSELNFYYECIKIQYDSMQRLEIEYKRITDSTMAAEEAARLQKEQQMAYENHIQDSIINAKSEIATKQYKAECIKKYGAKRGAQIAAGEVDLGMTKTMCEYAWGTPEKTSKSLIGSTVVEIWSYGPGRYLTFKNGVLVSMYD